MSRNYSDMLKDEQRAFDEGRLLGSMGFDDGKDVSEIVSGNPYPARGTANQRRHNAWKSGVEEGYSLAKACDGEREDEWEYMQ